MVGRTGLIRVRHCDTFRLQSGLRILAAEMLTVPRIQQVTDLVPLCLGVSRNSDASEEQVDRADDFIPLRPC